MTWLTYDSDSQREAFRYSTLDGQPLFDIIFCNQTVQVMDISAGGISFKNKSFKVGQVDRILLPIPLFLSPTPGKVSSHPGSSFSEPVNTAASEKKSTASDENSPRSQPMEQILGLTLNIRIIQISKNDICHAIFEGITDEAADILHQFVLERQKQDIRNRRIV